MKTPFACITGSKKSEAAIYSTIRQFPQQFLTSWQILQKVDLQDLPQGEFQRVYHVGMGGSSLPADLVNDYLRAQYPFNIIRDYFLPQDVGEKDLVILSSFSGNTEETIAALEDALERNTSIVVMSHGGRLHEMALQYDLPFISIPDCIQPRCATGYFFSSLLGLLERIGRIGAQQSHLEKLGGFLELGQDLFEARGKEIATALKNRVPIMYGPANLSGTCRFWKIKFNENSKIQSFYNVFPELNHNEMVGFSHLVMNPTLIFLKSRNTDPRIAKRMQTTEALLADRVPILSVELTGTNLLQDIFESLAIADYASYHLALLYGMNPEPVEMVEEFKKRLRSTIGVPIAANR